MSKQCPYCPRSVLNAQFGAHLQSCKRKFLNRQKNSKKKVKGPKNQKQCPLCQKKMEENNYRIHYSSCSKKHNNRLAFNTKKVKKPNEIQCKFCQKRMEENNYRIHYNSCKKKHKNRLEFNTKKVKGPKNQKQCPICEKKMEENNYRIHYNSCLKKYNNRLKFTTKKKKVKRNNLETKFENIEEQITRNNNNIQEINQYFIPSYQETLSYPRENTRSWREEDRENLLRKKEEELKIWERDLEEEKQRKYFKEREEGKMSEKTNGLMEKFKNKEFLLEQERIYKEIKEKNLKKQKRVLKESEERKFNEKTKEGIGIKENLMDNFEEDRVVRKNDPKKKKANFNLLNMVKMSEEKENLLADKNKCYHLLNFLDFRHNLTNKKTFVDPGSNRLSEKEGENRIDDLLQEYNVHIDHNKTSMVKKGNFVPLKREVIIVDFKNDESNPESEFFQFKDYEMDEVKRILDSNQESKRKIEIVLEKINKFYEEDLSDEKFRKYLSRVQKEECKESYFVPLIEIEHGQCRHKSILLKLICDRYKVKSRLIRGFLNNCRHAWNFVVFDDSCFLVDVHNNVIIDETNFVRELKISKYHIFQSTSKCAGGFNKDYFKMRRLHKTNFSKIFPYGKNFIVKEIDVSQGGQDLKHAFREIIMLFITHPCFVKVYDYSIQRREQEEFVCLVMDKYMCNLAEFIEKCLKTKKVSNVPQCVLAILYPVATALYYLHENHLVYADLKPHNILINFNKSYCISEVCLCDFGTTKSRVKKEFLTKTQFSGKYNSPEGKGGIINEKSDVYNFGLIMEELLLFSNFGELKKLVNSCKKEDTELRPSMKQVRCVLKEIINQITF